jgi:hypothetical protein
MDLARGAPVPSAAAEVARGHLGHCPECANAFARQRALSDALAGLADEPGDVSAPHRLESRLLEALAARHPGVETQPPASAAAGRWWVGAAAVVAAGIGLSAWLGLTRGAPGPSIEPLRPPAASVERPVGAQSESERPAGVGQAGAIREAPRARQRPNRATPAVARAPGAGALEFVAVPGADGLPPLESARIVRLELSAAALPAYGLQVLDGVDSGIEADVLVGQDGQARGIRLVALSPESRSRE